MRDFGNYVRLAYGVNPIDSDEYFWAQKMTWLKVLKIVSPQADKDM